MKYLYRRRLIIFVCVLGLNACTEVIELPNQSGAPLLAINGFITDQHEPCRVTISRSVSLFDQKTPVAGAQVVVISDDGARVILQETAPGQYESNPDELTGRVGRSYFVRVTMPDGELYQSDPEKILPPKSIGELSFEYIKEETLNELSNIRVDDKVDVYVQNPAPTQAENAYYKWEATGEYEFRESEALTDIFATTGIGPLLLTCYVYDPIRLGEIYLFDGSNLQGKESFQRLVKSIPVDYKFIFHYCVHIKQYSITKEAHEFWRQAQILSERNGLFLDPRPGTIRGNITNINDPAEEVLGFFYTASMSYKRLFISPDDIDKPASPCLLLDPAFEEPCMECLELDNSYRGAPDYWPR